MGLSTYPDFQTYHRVLNRAVWSPLKASRLLWRLWLPGEVIVLGLDDTIERRRGNQIHAKGIDRDPVRSSRSHFVQVSGWRWLSGMPLSPIAWANHVGALPFLTVRCPSERFYEQRGRRPQSLTECTWPIIRPVRRWLPQRDLAVGADSRFTALELLNPVKRLPRTSLMTRLRLDAALYAPAPPPDPGTTGRPPAHGQAPPHPGGRVGR